VNQALQKRISQIVIITLVLSTVVISPWANMDTVNLPKFSILIFGSFLSFAIVFSGKRSEIGSILQSALICTPMIGALLMNIAFHGTGSKQLFGLFGSNVAFFSLLAQLIVFLMISNIHSFDFSDYLVKALLISGSINVMYGLTQYFDLDPINWVSPYNRLTGTFGNPNFFSSLLGICGVATLSILVGRKKNLYRLTLGLFLIAIVFLIVQSKSIQGVFALLFASSAVIYLRFIREKSKLFRFAFQALFLLFVAAISLGVMGKGSFSFIGEENSVVARRYYWLAAIEMFKDNAIIGYGFDSFADQYRSYRSPGVISLFGPNLFVNSAHNYFLDILVFGGIPLLVGYALILVRALVATLRIIRNMDSYDSNAVSLIACWVAANTHSLVSPIQIGLSIWVWAFSGALVGYETFNTKRRSQEKKIGSSFLSPLSTVTGAIGLIIATIVTLPILLKDIQFRKGVEIQNEFLIKQAVVKWPYDSYYANYATELLLASKVNEGALDMAKLSVSRDPRNYLGWQFIANNPISTQTEKSFAFLNMKKIDPNFKQ
jgi:hypothetical protein